ncbi:MAG: hypothetical protein AAGF07_00245 [Patescibacteria group bacterium]
MKLKYQNYLNGTVKNFIFWSLTLLLWELLSVVNLVNHSFFTSPSLILQSVRTTDFLKIFVADLTFSYTRIVIGISLGIIISYLLIFLTTLVPKAHFIISRIQQVLRYLPAPIMIPISILIFGISEQTKIAVISLTTLFLYLNYLIVTINKEERQYQNLQKSWNLTKTRRFKHFILPITLLLSYRIIPSIVIWAFGVGIISEIIVGAEFGFGVRIAQLQQTFRTDFLYTYVVLIIFLAFIFEYTLANYLSRLRWSKLKISCAVLVLLSLLFSIIFSFYNHEMSDSKSFTVFTYRATANLPLIVYQEKFNSEFPIKIKYLGSGAQVMDTILAEKGYIGGYSDMPNVISGAIKSKNLKIVSQIIELPNHPNLFLISQSQSVNDLSDTNNQKVGYFPNNPIIKQGLDLFLFNKKVRTSSIEYVTSNDPNSLTQAFSSGDIHTLLMIEPYVTELENIVGKQRLNPDQTLASDSIFNEFPLAGIVINTDFVNSRDQVIFARNLENSIEFIRQNTDERLRARDELRVIMQANNLNPNSQISAYQSGSEIAVDSLNDLINFLKLYIEDSAELTNLESRRLYLEF